MKLTKKQTGMALELIEREIELSKVLNDEGLDFHLKVKWVIKSEAEIKNPEIIDYIEELLED